MQNKKGTYKAIIKKSLPAILSGILGTLVPFIDNFASGILGDNAISVVSFTSYITMVFMMASIGVYGIFDILMGQYNGKNDKISINKLYRLKLIFGLGIMAISSMLMFIIPKELLNIFTNDQKLIEEGFLYVRLYGVVLILIAFSMALSTSLNTLGKTVITLFGTIIAIAINALLDLTLIYQADMGVEGLAYATIAVQFALIIFYGLYIYIIKLSELYFNLINFFKLNISLLRKAFKNWPNIIMTLSYSVAILLTTILMSRAYDDTIYKPGAIMGILSPFTSLLFTGITGFGPAIYFFISRELGNDNFDVAKENGKKVMKISMIVTLSLSALISALAIWEVELFANASEETKNEAFWDLLLYVAVMPAFGIGWLSYQILAAGGQSKATIIFDTVFLWVIYTGLTVLVFFTWKPSHFWVAWIISQTTWYLRGIVGYILYKQGLWLTNLTKENPKKLVGFSYYLQVICTLGLFKLFNKNK
ncbi:MAG: MATE family efflux transporter [Mycoplasmatales bacterium]|nr:MATE family efflux transporter [Mycoplasmatales bacterium]